MTDNRTTEITATERICEQLEAAGVSFVRSEQIIEGTYWGVTWFIGETKFEFRENDKRTDLIAFNATPEQAIAATLGKPIIRCRDCRHATISTTGVCKYCEMFVLPDVDGYGADSQVNLPLDFFCGFAERKEVDE